LKKAGGASKKGGGEKKTKTESPTTTEKSKPKKPKREKTLTGTDTIGEEGTNLQEIVGKKKGKKKVETTSA